MRVPLVGLLTGFAVGVVVVQGAAALPVWPAAWLVAGLLGCGVIAWSGRIASMPASVRWSCAFALAVSTGFGYAGWRAELRLSDALPVAWEGRDIQLTGIVDELPTPTANGVRFAFAVESVTTREAVVPRRLSLAWTTGWAGRAATDAPLPIVHAGERWQLTVRVKRPHGNANPGGFDLEAWLLQQNLRATGAVIDATSNQRVDAFAGRARDHLQRARERIRARILAALPDAPYAGIVVALAIGDQRAIPEAQWTVLNRTGIGHLVSISGLHVTVFATFIGTLAFGLARRSTWLTSRRPARQPAALVGLLAAAGYVALAGAEVPALRTLAMLAVAATGICIGRAGTAALVWLWALVAVLLWDPWSSLTPGFWLSFGAVGMLLYAAAGRLSPREAPSRVAQWRGAVREGVHAQWVVTLGLTPLTLMLFAQMSLIAPVANAVAIPVVTIAVVPLALLGIFVPVNLLFVGAHAILAPLMQGMEWLARLPDAAWQQHAPPWWAVVAGIVGIALLLAPRGVPGRAWGWLWLLPVFLARPPPLPEGAFRMTVLDVGQGLAVVIETRSYTLVYDTGPRFTETADAGNRIVVPFLRTAGLRRIDGLMVSHQDLDHSGGARSLLQVVPVGWFASSLFAEHELIAALPALAPPIGCHAGQQWSWDAVRFTMLHPTAAEYTDVKARTNDRSCVLRVDSVHGSALLTGDIEAITELRLVGRAAAQLRADVVLVPHHGSRTSSIPAFVRAAAPTYAVVTSGYRNRFGHPRAEVVARYRAVGAQVLRTDLDGAIAFTFAAGMPVVPLASRREAMRYWHDRPDAQAAPLD
jgi:competence protein ComEC